MIPKIIYQTWYSNDVPEPIQKEIDIMMNINKGWERKFYNDNDIENFIKKEYDEYTLKTYKKINIGAAKADFWRYLILYKYGGVYLDIDSIIVKPLDLLINHDTELVISRERNKDRFTQWLLIVSQGHEVLKKCIDKCMYNINNRSSINHVDKLTGPTVYTESLKEVFENEIYFLNDSILNTKYQEKHAIFNGFDYEKLAKYKLSCSNLLYKNRKHWIDDQSKNQVVI